jgi:mono/diheme cytochrome c family protein
VGETTTTETTETTETETTETTTTDETETETETDETETETTPAAEGEPAAGKQVFLGASACGGCHTLADAGTNGQVGPNLDESQPDYELALDRVTNGQGGMPSFSSTLSEQQIADVSAYVASVAGS